MKKTLILVAVMVLALGVAANASWLIQMNGYDALDGANSGTVQIGEMPNATGDHAPGTPASANCMVAIGWTANPTTTYWQNKLYSTPGPSEVPLFVVNGGTYADAKIYVKIASPAAAYQAPGTWYVYNEDKTAALWSGVLPISSTIKAAPTGFSLDASTAGYRLWLQDHEEPIVPEPGSLLALGTGLIGLVGFGIRRRK